MKTASKNNIILAGLLLLILSPLVFLKLDAFPLKLWDESVFATNAYEMLQRKEFIVPYYNGKIDMWNSKPPLMIWTQMASVKLFGYNELAIRLPSAIAVALTILLLFFFLKRHIDSTFAWIAVLALFTSPGFLTFHTGRTGDADALLTLLLTMANIIVINSVVTGRFRNKDILLFFITITLAFYCKGLAAFLFGLGYGVLYVVYKKNFSGNIFKKSGFWLGLLLLLLLVSSFIALRNHRQEGYLNYILSVDAGRILKEIENHREPFSYYIENLSIYNFHFCFVLSVIGMLMLFGKNREEKAYKILMTSSILLLSYLLIISCSVTKVPWYTMPLYPLFAIAAAMPIYYFVRSLNMKPLACAGIILMIFAFPYKHVFGLSQSNSSSPYEQVNEAGERYIFNEIKQGHSLDRVYVLHSGYDRGMKFYQYKLKEQGITLFVTDQLHFSPGNVVIVSRDSLKNQLKDKFACLLLDSVPNVCKYKILSDRE